ncbi:MAG: DUF559 domain-containing protein [Planctomycetota bacterium]
MPEPRIRQTDRARKLRQDQSPAETVLGSRLRAGRLGGHKFRRQHPVGLIVVDFCCPRSSLVVELDSESHAGRRADDARRDAICAGLGFRVLRVTASRLSCDEDAVLATILRWADEGVVRDL